MAIPRWIFFLVAVWVIAFGVFRIVVAVRRQRLARAEPDRPNFMKRGLYALSPRTHILFGVVYILLGGCLVAMGLGWQPGSGCLGEQPPPTVEGEKVGALVR
jgi:uncharacterized membrane protein HdeD (DUF308 family)